MYYYLIQFLIGGILFILLYHFTKENNTLIASIIPALPILFLVGLFYLIYFDGNTINYTNNSLYTYGLLFIFLVVFNVIKKNTGKSLSAIDSNILSLFLFYYML